MKKIISTTEAPAAIGPYSQAVLAGDFLYISGQLPVDPTTGKIVAGNIKEQTHQVIRNIKAIAEEAGVALSDAVKTTVYIKDLSHFSLINEVYAEYFDRGFPARAAFEVAGLPMDAGVEIESVFYLKKP